MNLQAPRLPLSRGAGPNGLRGAPAAAGQRLPLQGSWLGAAETERLLEICHETQTANSVCGLERKKRAQRKRGSANSGDSFRRGRF